MTQSHAMQAHGSNRTPKLSMSQACDKCSQDMCITVAPHLLHTTSNALCHMRMGGCVPVDVLPCWFGAQCEACGAPAAMRHVQVRPSPTALQDGWCASLKGRIMCA